MAVTANDSSGREAGLDAPSAVLSTLGVDSGGFYARDYNDLAPVIGRIAADADTYYVLGFRMPEGLKPGRFRRLTVKVDRTGLLVRARLGYLTGR